jgi:hypothetical protein
MTRLAMLQAARHWLPTYRGKKAVRGYAKWFGVDLGCALKELQILGVALDPGYVERLSAELQNRARRRPAAKEPSNGIPEGYGSEWDDDFACIVGFTSGGAPYGVTWEQDDEFNNEDRMVPEQDDPDPDSVPF